MRKFTGHKLQATDKNKFSSTAIISSVIINLNELHKLQSDVTLQNYTNNLCKRNF